MGLNNENALLVGRPWLVFDIETMPLSGCDEYLTDPVEAPSNYKDPVKIAAYIADAKKKQIEKAALDLDLCEIAAIGLRLPDDDCYAQTRGSNSEEDMLRGFWSFVSSVQRNGGVIAGFNCLHFDLPILLRRSLYLGIQAPTVNIDKYRHDGVIDVADVLTHGGKTTWRSLGFYAKRFGIPHDDSVKGEDVPALVGRGAWDAVAAHVRADVTTTAALVQRIGLIAQPVIEETAAVA